MASDVILCGPDYLQGIAELLHDYGITVDLVADGAAIPGSFWGDNEAGLIGDHLFVRRDTPLHSALHEACHFICMEGDRRARLHTDAGGDVAEENAVCYLQGLLADEIAGFKRARLFADMDAWGYTFRLGSARTWFEQDASDAKDWLIAHRIIDNAHRPTGALRR